MKIYPFTLPLILLNGAFKQTDSAHSHPGYQNKSYQEAIGVLAHIWSELYKVWTEAQLGPFLQTKDSESHINDEMRVTREPEFVPNLMGSLERIIKCLKEEVKPHHQKCPWNAPPTQPASEPQARGAPRTTDSSPK